MKVLVIGLVLVSLGCSRFRGKNGSDGDGCIAKETSEGVVLECQDGDLLIPGGKDGEDGKDGKDGSKGEDGHHGDDGGSGDDGDDGRDGGDGRDYSKNVCYLKYRAQTYANSSCGAKVPVISYYYVWYAWKLLANGSKLVRLSHGFNASLYDGKWSTDKVLVPEDDDFELGKVSVNKLTGTQKNEVSATITGQGWSREARCF